MLGPRLELRFFSVTQSVDGRRRDLFLRLTMMTGYYHKPRRAERSDSPTHAASTLSQSIEISHVVYSALILT